MKARELIKALLEVDMDAEVMISAPQECSKGDPRPGRLDLPTLGIRAGAFVAPEGSKGKPWVIIQGTDVWGQLIPQEELERLEKMP